MRNKYRTKPWCNHYSGMHQKEHCDAGVRFDSLANYGSREFMDSCPCFGNSLGVCEKAEYPTPEQIEDSRKALDARLNQMAIARSAIVDHLGGPWKRGVPSGSGSIECPVCKQSALIFSRSGYNGHIHAACQTEGCVRWME